MQTKLFLDPSCSTAQPNSGFNRGFTWMQLELDAYSRLLPGQRVILQGLSAAELNGQTGRLESFHADRGRWAVCLGNTRKLLKPDNLQVVSCAFQGNVVTDILSEDLFFRVCLFLPSTNTACVQWNLEDHTILCGRERRVLFAVAITVLRDAW